MGGIVRQAEQYTDDSPLAKIKREASGLSAEEAVKLDLVAQEIRELNKQRDSIEWQADADDLQARINELWEEVDPIMSKYNGGTWDEDDFWETVGMSSTAKTASVKKATSDAEREAMTVLQEVADTEFIRECESLVQSGAAQWFYDPEHVDVIGLMQPGTNNAYVVVYVKEMDFEEGEMFHQAKTAKVANVDLTDYLCPNCGSEDQLVLAQPDFETAICEACDWHGPVNDVTGDEQKMSSKTAGELPPGTGMWGCTQCGKVDSEQYLKPVCADCGSRDSAVECGPATEEWFNEHVNDQWPITFDDNGPVYSKKAAVGCWNCGLTNLVMTPDSDMGGTTDLVMCQDCGEEQNTDDFTPAQLNILKEQGYPL